MKLWGETIWCLAGASKRTEARDAPSSDGRSMAGIPATMWLEFLRRRVAIWNLVLGCTVAGLLGQLKIPIPVRPEASSDAWGDSDKWKKHWICFDLLLICALFGWIFYLVLSPHASLLAVMRGPPTHHCWQ